MIRRVYSSLPSFKTLEFHEGVNLVLADVEAESGSRRTRNGAGKSSLVEIVNFVLGSSVEKGSLFQAPDLADSEFGLVFDLGDTIVDASRPTIKPNWVNIHDGQSVRWPLSPYIRPRGVSIGMTINDWKQVLGTEMFGLTGDLSDSESCEPSFRSLIGYFLRRQSAGGLVNYMTYWRNEGPGEQQVSISYLAGLDWRLPCQWETVRKRLKHLKQYKEIKREGLLGRKLPDAAHLRTQLTIVEDRLRRLQKDVADFRVVPGYEDMEAEANAIASNLRRLAQEDSSDARLVSDLQANLSPGVVPSGEDARRVFAELGLVLPDNVVRRFDEVEVFHSSIVRNRQLTLEGQLSDAQGRIESRRGEADGMGRRLSELLRHLDQGGALSLFGQLQAEASRLEATATDLRRQMEAAEQFEGGKSELEVKKHQLMLRLRQVNRESPDALQHAIVVFGEIASALYEEGGSLTIGESTAGPTFEVQMHARRSTGISKMAIFAFDLMLARVTAERGTSPGFLVHDSHLYDGVDDRQKAIALNLANEYSKRWGFQYIVTMNSNDLPSSDLTDFDLEGAVVRPVLTDKTATGGLFGMRFD